MNHSLSLIQDLKQNGKYNGEEEKLHYTILNYKIKVELLLTLPPSFWNPRGVFIGIRRTGGQGTGRDPKRRARRGRIAAETRQKRRFRGCPCAARAAPPVVRCLVVALSDKVVGFWFGAPGFDRTSSLGQ